MSRILTKIFISISILYILIDEIECQYGPMLETRNKPGSCPPPLPRSICRDTCRMDLQCPGNYKCCRTSCGGTVCSRAVTARQNINMIKPGRCPNPSNMAWLCSSTCLSDTDCPSRAKCCRNRCGASICTSPIID